MSRVQREPSICRECPAEIIWCKTPAGKNIPIDAEPAEDGKFVMIRDNGTRIARSPNYGEDDLPRHHAHWVTCPNADKFRSGNRDTAPPPLGADMPTGKDSSAPPPAKLEGRVLRLQLAAGIAAGFAAYPSNMTDAEIVMRSLRIVDALAKECRS